MTCPPGSDRAFGPRVDLGCRSLDFTLQFEDIFLTCLPAAVFLLLAPLNITVLLKWPTAFSPRSKLLTAKLVALSLLFAMQLVFLALRVRNESVGTTASVAADVLSVVATGTAIVVCLLDHQRSPRPSTILALYLSASGLLGLARVRTLWLLPSAGPEAPVLTVTFALTVSTLVLESIENKKGTTGGEKATAGLEKYSGFWIRATYAWLAATFKVGYAKIISVNDLPPLEDKLASRSLHMKLQSTWRKYDNKKRHSLLMASFHTYIASFLSVVIPRLCQTAFVFAQPFLINTTVTFVGENNPDSNYGKGLIGAWALVYVGIAVSRSMYSYQKTRFTTRLRGGLVALIYQRVLQTKAFDQGDITAIALMGTDVERIVTSLAFIHEIWAAVIEIAIASWLLERQLFLACLAPILLVLVFIAATTKLAGIAKTSQRLWIEKVQERLRATSAVLDDMKAVKLLGLSRSISQLLQMLRVDEIKSSKRYRKVLVVIILLSNTPIMLAPIVTFVIYIVIAVYWKSETLLTAQAFTSISLISLLTVPVIIFIQILPLVVQSIGFFDRIQEFCNYADNVEIGDEVSTANRRVRSEISLRNLEPKDGLSRPNPPHNEIIDIDGWGFKWNKTGPEVLKDLNVQVRRGIVTALVGPVGSGKSAFLNSLLGEMISVPTTPGKSAMKTGSIGPVAYCSQQPWLENRSIRENIVGVLHYDRAWYRSVTAACGLEADLESLDKGDRTRVGSKGVSLSGGQKQRIALARAVYSQRRIVLLDDVFSGMDAHTTDTVLQGLLGREGLLRKNDTAVILATHNHKIMALADTIVAFEDGNIIETGSPATLLHRNGYVSTLKLKIAEADVVEGTSEGQDLGIARGATHKSDAIADDEAKISEDLRRKKGDFSVYKYYISKSGYVVVTLYGVFVFIWMLVSEFSTIWIKWWSEANAENPNQKLGIYIGVYVMLGIVGTLCSCIGAWCAFIPMISNSSLKFHFDILQTTLSAPFRFFTTTDSGDLLNRFSQDLELISMELPRHFVNYTATVFSVVVKVVVLAIFSQYLGAAVPVVGVCLYFLQSFYLRTSRQLRLLGIEAQAPLYSHFTESVAGAPTIRAFGWKSEHQERNYSLLDTSQQPAYILQCVQNWLSFVLDLMVGAIAVVLIATVVTWHDKFNPGSVGVSLIMVMGFSETLARLMGSWTLLESSIGAVARVKRFTTDTDAEDAGKPGTTVPASWPHSGAVEFDGLAASYGLSADPILRDVSMSIQAGQHVAFCGRSGSGKTSLLLCLFKMLDVRDGRVVIDGIDIAELHPEDVRSRINAVPQDPFFMPGTIRFNIDPFNAASDDDIVHALERVNLWGIIESQGGLDKDMDATAWSAGQKQLLCLARAMVRKCKILILDEAMSNVDAETEAVMQNIIKTEFGGCTVLAIMHRLEYVTQYDLVALMGDGALLEYGEPAALIAGDSSFAELYRTHLS